MENNANVPIREDLKQITPPIPIIKVNIAEILENAVRTVGTFRPKFDPRDGKVFSDELLVKGTAFWLKDYKVLITCAHVVEDILRQPLALAGLLVVGNHGQYQRAIVSHFDYQHDLAVLTLVDGNTGVPLNNQVVENEASNGLEVTNFYSPAGASVAWSGYPLGNQLLNEIHAPTYSEGVIGIQKRDNGVRKEIQISGIAVGGYSGSPVINKDDGKLIGVIAHGPENAGIFMAISFEHINALAKLAKS